MTEHGIVQHYIFQCRPVKGVSNRFQVPLREGRKIVDDALTMQNGLGKSADYTMSHVTGKIAILGEYAGKMLFKYRQCPDKAKLGKIFALDVGEEQAWLPDILSLGEF
jgi:L-lysine 2,3-aminomutase